MTQPHTKHWCFPLTEKTPALDELDAGQEMTEEEWTRRVAELNKHQVGQTNTGSSLPVIVETLLTMATRSLDRKLIPAVV